jgi:hypothetical protein
MKTTARLGTSLTLLVSILASILVSIAACATGTKSTFEPSQAAGPVELADSGPLLAGDSAAPAADAGTVAARDAAADSGDLSEDSAPSPASDDAASPVVADSSAAPDSSSDAGALATVGSAEYVVTSVNGFGMYCVDLDDAVFGTVGDVITVDFTSSGVTLIDTGATLPNCGYSCADLPVGTQMISNLGGSVDTQTGQYTSNDTYSFVDDQNPGGETGSSQFYYSLTLTLEGNTLVVTFKIPNPQGDVTCTLTRQ